MNRKKVEKEIKKLLDFDITKPNGFRIEEITGILGARELIGYSINVIEDNNDSYLQVDYYDETIKKTVILDYEIPDSFESIEYFINLLAEEEKEMERIKKIIKN